MCRIVGCTLLLCLLAVFFFPANVESHSVLKKKPEKAHEHGVVTGAPPRYPPAEQAAPSVKEPLLDQEPLATSEDLKTKIWKDEHPIQRPIATSKAADTNIEKAISRLRDLFPDEVRMKGLLSPLTETGEALLRDLAYRTRAFKEVLSVWESLHLVPSRDGTELLLRDVIPYLRRQGLSSASFAEAVHTYDKFRAYINKFAARLFPWTMAFYADHMSLHASFYSGGKGIVLTAGDQQAQYLLTTIPSFRKLGCDLPIEVLYLGDEDLSEDYRESLEAMPGVLTRDLSQMVNDEGWALKGKSMYSTLPSTLTRSH